MPEKDTYRRFEIHSSYVIRYVIKVIKAQVIDPCRLLITLWASDYFPRAAIKAI